MNEAGYGVLDLFKVLGTIGGLVSPVFLLFDRLIRNRPFASIQLAKVYDRLTDRFALRIYNASDEAILCTSIVASGYLEGRS